MIKLIQKLVFVMLSLFVLLWLAAPSLLGFSIFHLGHAVNVSTGMSAKLACSAYFVSGFDKTRIIDDLATYSPAARVVDIVYDEQNHKVTTSLFGLATTSAKYNESTGCSLDYGQPIPTQKRVVFEDNLPWPKGNKVETIAQNIQDLTEQIVRADNERGYNTRALLVVHDGKVVAESYGPNITKDTKLLGWSMAKSVTAIMVGNLELQGLLSRDDKQLFAQWRQDSRNDIQLQQLLNMTSGLKFDETYAPGSDATNMLFTAKSASDVALSSELAYSPNEFFYYSSGTTNLLQRLIKNTLASQNKDDIDYLYSTFFKPLSMNNSIFEQDSNGVFVGSSYLYATARDWAKWGLLMLNKGQLNGQKFLSEQWVSDAVKPNPSSNEKAYGYQFWLNRGDDKLRWPDLPIDAYAMMGNRKQSIMMFPSQNAVFVRLGWSSGAYPMEANYAKLLAEFMVQ